jgi:integrase/recombinase XerD
MGRMGGAKGQTVTLKGLMPSSKGKAGKVRWYVRRKGLPLVPMPDLPHDDPRFLAAYAAAWTAAAPEKPHDGAGTVAAHIKTVFASPRYRAASASYKAALTRHAMAILDECGHFPIAGLKDRHIAADVDACDVPDMRLKAWRFLCKPLRPDPSRSVRAERQKGEGYQPWAADDIARFRARWPIGTAPRAAMELLFWTGARISDGVRIGRGNIGGDGVLSFRQQKTGRPAYVPWSCTLPEYAADMADDRAMMFEAIEPFTGHMTFLATKEGQGRSAKALGTMIRDACAKAGVAKSAHGLRKARATALAEGGATTHEIAAWTGHDTLSEVQRYTEAADRRRAVTGAIPSRGGVQSRK